MAAIPNDSTNHTMITSGKKSRNHDDGMSKIERNWNLLLIVIIFLVILIVTIIIYKFLVQTRNTAQKEISSPNQILEIYKMDKFGNFRND